MKQRGRLRRGRRASGCAIAAATVLLAVPVGASARPGDELRPRSLHLTLASIATRDYAVGVETLGHHRVVLSVQKGGQFASYTVKGKVSRHRIKADFGRFGRISLRFHGKPRRFVPPPKGKRPRPRYRCKGRRPEREVGHFRGTVVFEGQRSFTKLAVGKAPGEVRRSYRQLCRPLRRRSRASISSSAATDPFGFTLTVLTARARLGGALARFNAVSLESPLGIRLPGDKLFSVVSASLQERVGRVRVYRSAFQVAEPNAIRVSQRGVKPVSARVALDPPFSGSARYKGAGKSSTASWTGSLSVRLLGGPPLPLTGERYRAKLCRAGAFTTTSPCFRRAEARVAAQGSGSHSHPLAEARLSSFR
jgi:hypothetical protein